MTDELVTHMNPCPYCGCAIAATQDRLVEAWAEHVRDCELRPGKPTEFPDGRSAWVGQ